MPDSELRLSFTNLHADNSSLAEDWELLLRIVADFEISVAGQRIYSEQEFCVVEFGVQALNWARKPIRTDFFYRTMEAEEAGIVSIKKAGAGWQVGSIYQLREARPLPMNVIRKAIEDYWVRLHDSVKQCLDRDISSLPSVSAKAVGILTRANR